MPVRQKWGGKIKNAFIFRKWKVGSQAPPHPGFGASNGRATTLALAELRRANEQSMKEKREFKKWWKEQQALQQQIKQQQMLQEVNLQQQMAMQTKCLQALLEKAQNLGGCTSAGPSVNQAQTEEDGVNATAEEDGVNATAKDKHVSGKKLAKGSRKSSRVTSESIGQQVDGNVTDGESEFDDVVADRDYLPESSGEETDDGSSIFTTANEDVEVQSLRAEAGPSTAQNNLQKTKLRPPCTYKDCGKPANQLYLDQIFEEEPESNLNDSALIDLYKQQKTQRLLQKAGFLRAKQKVRKPEDLVAKRIAEMNLRQASLPKFVSPVRGLDQDDDPEDFAWVTNFDLQVDSGPLDFFRITATFDECHEAYQRFLSKFFVKLLRAKGS